MRRHRSLEVRCTLLVLVLFTSALVTGCIHVPRSIETIPPGQWLVRNGDTRHAAFADEHVPAQVRIAWDEGLGRGLPATPIVHDDLLIAVVSGGGIITASAVTGERYWTRRFNGGIAGQALRVEDRIFIATHHRSGNVYALDMRRGRRIWGRKLDARPTAEPAYADGVLYLPTDRGEILAIDAARGGVLWRSRIGGTTVQPALVAGGHLLLAVRDTLLLVDRMQGAVVRRTPIAAVPTAPFALAGDTVIVAGDGIVAAYAGFGAQPLWQHTTSLPTAAAPVLGRDGAYVLTRTAALLRVDAAGVHTIAQLAGGATGSLTLTADGLLVGLLDGRLLLVRFDGTIAWEEQLEGSLRAPAAVRDSSIYVPTLAGRLIKLSP